MPKLPKDAEVLEARDGVTVLGLPPHPKQKYPLWKIEALQENINQAENNILKFEQHIMEQKQVIKERKEQIALCQERDREVVKWEKMMEELDG